MLQQIRTLLFALSLLAVMPAFAQEAEPPSEAKPADEIVVEILGLENDTGQFGCRA